MSIFLGDRPVSVFFNGAAAGLPVQGVFLGGIQVFSAGAAVPGAPTILSADTDGSNTVVLFSPPSSAGGSAISGYKFYITDGQQPAVAEDEVTPTSIQAAAHGNLEALIPVDGTGLFVEMSALNDAGEGTRTLPFPIELI
jgi:hypothetical protein